MVDPRPRFEALAAIDAVGNGMKVDRDQSMSAA
jgi:hypothetical protein